MKISSQTAHATLNSICIAIIAIIAIISFSWSIPKSNKGDGYDTALEYIRELELGYVGTKSKLVDEVQSYIDSVSPNSALRALVLVDKCESYSVDVKFTLAQGEAESHFGTKGLALKTNCVWNIGAFDGLNYQEISNKYKFSNPNESIDTYLKHLTQNYLVGKIELDLMDNFVDINGNRYASDENYEYKLKNIYNNIIKSTKIDSLQQRLYYYKVRLNK